MKRGLLIILLTFIAFHAPWRLAALVAETLSLHPGETRFSQTDDQYWEAMQLEGRVIALGYRVGYVNGIVVNGFPAYGVTDNRQHLVEVDASLHWNARFAVLAHEAGHVVEPIWVHGQSAEVFAEMVAALVARDGLREHARWLSDSKGEVLLMALTEWPAIYHAAALLEDR
jgi:hypothetical protein